MPLVSTCLPLIYFRDGVSGLRLLLESSGMRGNEQTLSWQLRLVDPPAEGT